MTKKVLNGKVIKDKNDKTVVVLVKRKYSHPFFGKVITSSKKYHAHDEKTGRSVTGIMVSLKSTPIMWHSKRQGSA